MNATLAALGWHVTEETDERGRSYYRAYRGAYVRGQGIHLWQSAKAPTNPLTRTLAIRVTVAIRLHTPLIRYCRICLLASFGNQRQAQAIWCVP